MENSFTVNDKRIVMNKHLTFLVMILAFNIISLNAQMYILNEDFSTASGTTPPSGWSNILISGTAEDVWHFDNPGGQTAGFPIITPFAIFDADSVSGNNQPEQVALQSPAFDASISNFIILEFDHKYIQGSGSSCKIQAFNGSDWFDVITYTSSVPTVAHAIVDISAYAGGITNARLRFLWSGNGSGYWAFDNVRIYAALPVDAGIISLDNPVTPFNGGIHEIKVTLRNFGYQDLTSSTIKWSINDVQQPDYSWAGDLGIGIMEQNIG